MMTAQVNVSWEIWRYSPELHPDGSELWTVPQSCCIPDSLTECGLYSNNISGIYSKDCYIEAKAFVVSHSTLMGSVAIAVVCIQVRAPKYKNSWRNYSLAQQILSTPNFLS